MGVAYQIVASWFSSIYLSNNALLSGKLSLGNDNAQVGETYAMIKALNKLTGLGMPKTQYAV